MIRSFAAAALILFAASPLPARVVSSGPNGFEIQTGQETRLTPAQLYALFGRPALWWDPAHSYSGSASRLSLDLRPGGCFCERLDRGGGVEHMRVAFVDPGKRIVLTGGLGPLLYEGVSAVMDVRFEQRGPDKSLITVNYRAAGFARGNAADLAPQVERVLRSQVDRLFARSRRPNPFRD